MPIPFLNSWLTDFVFVPLILHTTSIIGVFVLKPFRPFRFPPWQILILCTYISLVYEGLAPRFTNYNVGDWGDVIAYFLGGSFYYFIHNPYLIRKLSRIYKKND